MKRLLFLLLLIPFFGRTQSYQLNNLFGTQQNRIVVLYDLGIPKDTFPVPVQYQSWPHLAGHGDSIYRWSPTQLMWILIGGGGGGFPGVTSVNVAVGNGDALSSSGGPITTNGTINLNFTGLNTEYIRANGTKAILADDVATIGNGLWSPLGHTHIPAEIQGLTQAVHGMFTGGANIDVNPTTGVISFTGTTGTGSSDGIPTGLSFSGNTLTVSRQNTTSLTATIPMSSKVNVSDTATMLDPYKHWLAGYLTSYTETDPVWTAASGNYYTKTNLQTSGQASVHWGNITNAPAFLTSYTETDPVYLANGEKLANKATDFSILNNTLFPTTLAVSNYLGNNSIQNQNASAQTGNFWIDGNGSAHIFRTVAGTGNPAYYFPNSGNGENGLWYEYDDIVHVSSQNRIKLDLFNYNYIDLYNNHIDLNNDVYYWPAAYASGGYTVPVLNSGSNRLEYIPKDSLPGAAIPNLQQVTNVSYSTTNPLNSTGGLANVSATNGSASAQLRISGAYGGGLAAANNSGKIGNIYAFNLTANRDFQFPDKDGTLALTSDLSGLATNPMTTAGDMIVGGASGAPIRLAGGTNGYMLQMVSGSPAWVNGATWNGGVTSGQIGGVGGTIGTTVTVFIGSTTQTYTLPSLSTNKNYFVKNAGTANITVQRAGTDVIWDNGSVTSFDLAAGESVWVYGGTSSWYTLFNRGSGGGTTLSGTGYVKMSGTTPSYNATIPNADLTNSSITIAGNSTALGSSVTQDQITGLSSTGLVKRTGANTLAIATAGTDYLNSSSPVTTSQLPTEVQDLIYKNQYFTVAGNGLQPITSPNDSTIAHFSFDPTDFDLSLVDSMFHLDATLKAEWSGKQDALVSGTNIKTINGNSILGSGNITISGTGTGNDSAHVTIRQVDASTAAFDKSNRAIAPDSLKIRLSPVLDNSYVGMRVSGNTVLFDKANSSIAPDSLRIETSGVLAKFINDASNSGSAETDLYSYTLPVNKLASNGESVDFKFTGVATSPTAAQLKVYFQGSSIFFPTTITSTQNWQIEGTIYRVDATHIKYDFKMWVGNSLTGNTVSSSQIILNDMTTNTSVIKITGTDSAGGTITAKSGKIVYSK